MAARELHARNDGNYSEPYQFVIARRGSAVAIHCIARVKDGLPRRPYGLLAMTTEVFVSADMRE